MIIALLDRSVLLPALLFAQLIVAASPSITHQEIRGDVSIEDKAEFFLQTHNATLNLARSLTDEHWPGLNPLGRSVVPGAGALLCSPDTSCADGSCCSNDGICGYGPNYCGSGNCTSGCNATAMCGQYAARGEETCGMNICCSSSGWCGTTTNHCIGPDKFSPCLPQYGSCEMIDPPSCGQGSTSATQRTIGYYQASNVRERACNQITPAQINVTGYTHLYFAFASINPTTFQITPANDDDISLYTQFTSRSTTGLETWIAVGGFDFSDSGVTHTTWSDLCASPANRGAFIQSLIAFMDKYGFHGVDIDWEYPGDPTRGGGPADKENFVALLRDMHAQFGGKYGISVTLAPDYWYLRWFDAKAMEPYVNWFGFMAYDLHGAFDSTVKTLAPTVRGQADIREINNDTMPLWYDHLDPAKINFGVAWYGRGYTLSDPSCNTMGCGWTGPSKPGKCTGSPGVMSLVEIQDLIEELGIQPNFNEDAFMMELTFDDQWIGYDDEQSISFKKAYASASCFGGTMAWSVDFHSGKGESDAPPISQDGQCGMNSKSTCQGSTFGDCCSVAGYCGSDESHCGSGCQNTYGNCTRGGATQDGTCGSGHNDYTCEGWSGGECCSSNGFCGKGVSYCGKGCQSGCLSGGGQCHFGTCGGNQPLWQTYDCKKPEATDISINPKDRWQALDASTAWSDALAHWAQNDRGKTQLTFTESISNFFKGPIGMACGSMADRNGCNAFIQDCTTVGSPAGYLILNSLIAIQGINWNFWDSVSRTQADMNGVIDKLEATFAPVPKDSFSDKLILDVFGLIFAASAAPFWNSQIKKFSYWGDKANSNTLGTTKDTINSMVSNGVTISKDAMDADGNPDSAAVLKDNILTMIHGLRDGTDNLNKKLFSGEDDWNTILTALIEDGKAIPDAWQPSGDPEIMQMVERAFFMTLIPQAWALNTDGEVGPVVIDSGHECRATRTEDPFDNEYGILDEDAYTYAGICWQGTQYFLVGASGDSEDCSGSDSGGIGASIGCEDRYMSRLPGEDELDGTDPNRWAGLSKEDFAISSLLSFKANGNKNGWGLADPSSTAYYTGFDWDTDDMRRPGMTSIPVCSVAEARNNWQKYSSADHKLPSRNYPCN